MWFSFNCTILAGFGNTRGSEFTGEDGNTHTHSVGQCTTLGWGSPACPYLLCSLTKGPMASAEIVLSLLAVSKTDLKPCHGNSFCCPRTTMPQALVSGRSQSAESSPRMFQATWTRTESQQSPWRGQRAGPWAKFAFEWTQVWIEGPSSIWARKPVSWVAQTPVGDRESLRVSFSNIKMWLTTLLPPLEPSPRTWEALQICWPRSRENEWPPSPKGIPLPGPPGISSL